MREVPGACHLDCPDTCAWTVTVDGDRAVKLRGRKDHPVTAGSLCRKMNGFLDQLTRPDRLLQPQRRVGPKGPGARFEPIGWDDVFDRWAGEWTRILERHDAPDQNPGDRIWPFAGTGNLGLLQGIESGTRLFHHLGLAHHHASICSVSGYAGLSFSMGTPTTYDPEELVDSALILVWGANPVVAHTHVQPIIDRARRNGTVVVCIDPIRTASAERSDLHLALRPGTDGALALGLMAELVERGAVDTRFVTERAEGFDEFRRSLTAWSAVRAAQICDVPVEQVAQLVDLLVTRSPMAVKLGVGFQRHAGGGQAARVISCLPAITGDHDRPGGGLCYSTSHHYDFDRQALHRPDLRTRRSRTLVMTRLGRTLLEADPPVESLVVFGANPVVSNPDQRRVRAGLARDDLFTVVIDHLHTPTADYADLLLPTTMQPEHHELLRSYGHLYVHWNETAVPPAGECLPITEIWRRLARALDVDEASVYASDLDLAQAALAGAPSMAHVRLDDLRRDGFARLGHDRPLTTHAERFPTPSGRFELVSTGAEAAGFGRLPHYVPPAEAAPDLEPGAEPSDTLALLAPAGPRQLNSVFGDTDQPPLVLHPDDAARLGIAEGDAVTVANERGSFRITATVSDRTRRGVCLTAKGYWPAGDAPSVNATVAERDSDMAAGAVFHDNRVEVRLVAGVS